ncbi:hypothetical protein KR51_00009300 [Rubidibacter lacunae KORDI 51-2]|uniref:DUF4278 domain-containing protein n=2 Tax=Rubidibacter TaxID=582491 RepID=U5DNF9_9CHRO|nr:hypothetical protein KR51_00009300 [Rubidibacter lacunae KORDI 51-2]
MGEDRCQARFVYSLEENIMEFLFRGVHYHYQPSALEVEEGEVGGTYRGSPWRLHHPKQSVRRVSHKQMTYRGVDYQV